MRLLTDRRERWFHAFALANATFGTASLLIPLYAAVVLSASVGQVGLISSAASLAGVPAGILWGRLSDRLKRRKIFMIVGFTGVAIAFLLMGFSANLLQFVLLSALMNFAWMASASVSTLLVIERFDQSRWELRIGRFSTYGGSGWVAGLALGVLWMQLAEDGDSTATMMRALFYLIAFMTLVSALLAKVWVPESRQHVKRRRFRSLSITGGNAIVEGLKYAPLRMYHLARPRRLLEVIHPRRFGKELTTYYQTAVLFFTGFMIFLVPFPIFLKQVLGLSNSEIYLLYIINAGAKASLYRWAGKLAERFGNRRLQRTTLWVRVTIFPLAFLSLALTDHHLLVLAFIAVLFAVSGASWAFIGVSGVAIVSKLSGEGLRGQAIGTYNALAGIGGILGALIGGYLAEFSYLATFLLASLFLVASIGISTRVRFPN
ncbi:MAG: MFS transporter [Candidatus Bipolaricaulia bacterium]